MSFPLLLFICFLCSKDVCGIIPEASQEGYLRSFKNYKDVTMFHYTVPKEVLRATWQFAAFMDNENCPQRKVHIYLQWGSYPIILDKNATFPSHMYKEQQYQSLLTTYTDYESNKVTILPVYNPLPGDWFVGAFLSYWDEKVQQQGFGHKCQYSIGSVATWTKVNDIQNIPVGFQNTVKTTGRETYYKIYIPSNVWAFHVHIWACTFKLKNPRTLKEPCIQRILLQGRSLPSLNNTHLGSVENFMENDFYTFTELAPYEDSYYYLLIVSNSIIELNVEVTTTECPVMDTNKSQQYSKSVVKHATLHKRDIFKKPIVVNSSSDHQSSFSLYNTNYIETSDEEEKEKCIPRFQLARIEHSQLFSRNYILKGNDWIVLTDSNPTILQFDILPLLDIGGTLDVEAYLEIDKRSTEQVIVTNICIQRGRIPVRIGGHVVCENKHLSLNLSSNRKNDKLLIPYPQPDTWYITLEVNCYINRNPVHCDIKKIPVSLSVNIRQCVYPGKYSCGFHGTCQEIHRGLLHYSSCDCFGGYKDWGCSDDSDVNFQSSTILMTSMLTISNLFFLPAIYIAIRRGLYAEGLVYSATMLFSALYHACDQENATYCITNYEILQYSDFFSSTLAFWLTLVSMAELPAHLASLYHMFGVLIIAYGVESDKTSLSSILVPLSIGILIPIYSFIKYCYNTKSWNISKRTINLIIGFSLVGLGIVLYCAIETEANYYYVHSVWHATIAISLIYLLPPMRKEYLPTVNESTNYCNNTLFQRDATIKATSVSLNNTTDPVPVVTVIGVQDNIVTQIVTP